MLRIYWLPVCILTSFIQQSTSANAMHGPTVRYAKQGEFPSVVSLSYNNPDKRVSPRKNHFCGGTLITEKHVLTAAHCFKQLKRSHEIVVLISHGDLLKSEVYKVKRLTTYDKWANIRFTNGSFNDIAIVKLAEKVHANIKPAVTTYISETQLHGRRAIIPGWGIKEDNQVSQNLLFAEVDILKSEKCLVNIPNEAKTAHIFICTSAEPPLWTESGDSGNPLFINSNELIAVHKGSCEVTKNGIMLRKQNLYILIDHYKEFITDVIKPKSNKFKLKG